MIQSHGTPDFLSPRGKKGGNSLKGAKNIARKFKISKKALSVQRRSTLILQSTQFRAENQVRFLFSVTHAFVEKTRSQGLGLALRNDGSNLSVEVTIDHLLARIGTRWVLHPERIPALRRGGFSELHIREFLPHLGSDVTRTPMTASGTGQSKLRKPVRTSGSSSATARVTISLLPVKRSTFPSLFCG